MNYSMFPFYWKSFKEEHSLDHLTQGEIDWSGLKCICSKCGITKNYLEIRGEEYWHCTGWKCFGMPVEIPHCFLCPVCASDFYKYHETYKDLAALSTCVNYIQRAIQCRKHFQKTAEKSKQQDSLDKCLSMRQKECLTGIWTRQSVGAP